MVSANQKISQMIPQLPPQYHHEQKMVNRKDREHTTTGSLLPGDKTTLSHTAE
jgi:hypothetical protein